MAAHDTLAPVTDPVLLDTLDQATVRALCDAGYVTSRDYLDLAKANGWAPNVYVREREARLELASSRVKLGPLSSHGFEGRAR